MDSLYHRVPGFKPMFESTNDPGTTPVPRSDTDCLCAMAHEVIVGPVQNTSTTEGLPGEKS